MTDRVHFREDADLLAYVEGLGMNPNDFAKRLFEEEVCRLRAQERFRRIQQAWVRLPRRASAMVREERDRE